MDRITVTFFSNFLLHHQTPFCQAMVQKIGDGFHFVATERIPQERLDMGYKDLSHDTSYSINAYESEEQFKQAMILGDESDVVIIGAAPDVFIVNRLKNNKLTFRYAERFFKEGRWRILDPRVFLCHYKEDIRYRNKNLFMLCASAYTASDCRFIRSYPQKTFRWGYFPETRRYCNIEKIIQSKEKSSILWVGRLLELKHPEDAIFLAEELRKNHYIFDLKIIGDGEKKEELVRLIESKNMQDFVHIHGFMSPEEVREHMEKADIFLFTSDQNEGWGAVLNESMNSACAVVASKEIGSVPYLIINGENGFEYNRQKRNDLYFKVKRLLDDVELKKNIQRNAYDTITSVWNPETAAERLLHLIEYIREGKDIDYKNGPCSRDW